MKTPAQTIVRVLLLLFAVAIALLLARGCKSENEQTKAKNKVNEALQKPYADSDSAIGTLPRDSIRAKYEEIKRKRFPR